MSTEFTIRFDTGNAAFAEGDGPGECARILRRIAVKLMDGHEDGGIVDCNGNKIGTWSVEFPEDDNGEG